MFHVKHSVSKPSEPLRDRPTARKPAPGAGLSVHRDFTVREVAAYLRIGLSTVYEMVNAGKIPSRAIEVTLMEQDKPKQLLFSITAKDLEVQVFRAGGKGGQKQNKTSSAVRIIHRASGAVGEARDERSQHQNKKLAFQRMVASPAFQSWLKVTAAAVMQGYRNIEHKVDEAMKEENLKFEYFGNE